MRRLENKSSWTFLEATRAPLTPPSPLRRERPNQALRLRKDLLRFASCFRQSVEATFPRDTRLASFVQSNLMRVMLVYSNRTRILEPAPPIGLSYVATAAKRAGHDVRFVDLMISRDPTAELRGVLDSFQPQVVGFLKMVVPAVCRERQHNAFTAQDGSNRLGVSSTWVGKNGQHITNFSFEVI